jgi:hypothetical protein
MRPGAAAGRGAEVKIFGFRTMTGRPPSPVKFRTPAFPGVIELDWSGHVRQQDEVINEATKSYLRSIGRCHPAQRARNRAKKFAGLRSLFLRVRWTHSPIQAMNHL